MKAFVVAACVLTTGASVMGQKKGIDLAGGYAAGGVAQALSGMNAPVVYGEHLLLFGDENQKTFYGCITCPATDATSLNNPYGTYGNKMSGTSVLNPYAMIRNPYSTTSMCNKMATNPPIVVDGNGQYYGEATLNTTRPGRAKAPYLQRWVTATCATK